MHHKAARGGRQRGHKHLVLILSHIFEHSISLDRRSVSDRPEPKMPRIPHMVSTGLYTNKRAQPLCCSKSQLTSNRLSYSRGTNLPKKKNVNLPNLRSPGLGSRSPWSSVVAVEHTHKQRERVSINTRTTQPLYLPID